MSNLNQTDYESTFNRNPPSLTNEDLQMGFIYIDQKLDNIVNI